MISLLFFKEEYKKHFKEEFYNALGNEFLLLSKKEVIEQRLFGDGEAHHKFEEFIGDFLAIATSDKGIAYSHESLQLVSNHAGMTRQEIMVPFIAIEVRK